MPTSLNKKFLAKQKQMQKLQKELKEIETEQQLQLGKVMFKAGWTDSNLLKKSVSLLKKLAKVDGYTLDDAESLYNFLKQADASNQDDPQVSNEPNTSNNESINDTNNDEYDSDDDYNKSSNYVSGDTNYNDNLG